MEEIISVPNSLRDQLAQVQSLLGSGNGNRGPLGSLGSDSQFAEHFLGVIAKEVPELLVLLQLVQEGVKSVEIITTESDTHEICDTLQVKGKLPVRQITPITKSHTVRREIKFT